MDYRLQLRDITEPKTYFIQSLGETSEVSNAHIQGITTLLSISNTNVVRIHDFYARLLTNVNALGTLGKLNEINGYVRLTLDKLSGIRADLVRTDDNWKNWSFTNYWKH